MKNSRIRSMSYMALYVALYIVLKWVGNMIPFLQMPNGGSIELELIAVFIASYHLGWKGGLAVAILSWLITIVLGFPMYFYWPVQILLDYVLPLAACGIASLLFPIRDLNTPGAVALAVILAAGAFFGIYNSYPEGTAVTVGAIALAAGMFAFTYWYLKTRSHFGIVAAMLLKYVFQVLSGVYFWFPEGEAAGSAYAWTFSLSYNLWYNLVTMIVCIIVVPLLIDSLKHAGIKFSA
ncbi:MAG: energy-coupled thiamine transporter ThiT [Solobacterium sp.]|nr:energy-coupled thiamine transporter ThiT [Solobacterium sp.]